MDSLSPTLGDEEVAYYNNITGILRGNWYRIPKPKENMFGSPRYEDEPVSQKQLTATTGWGNVSYRETILGHSGKFLLDIEEIKKNSTVQFVEALLNIGKDNGDSTFSTKLKGVHFPNTGEVVLASTTPRKQILSI